jgi:hypothetical protein
MISRVVACLRLKMVSVLTVAHGRQAVKYQVTRPRVPLLLFWDGAHAFFTRRTDRRLRGNRTPGPGRYGSRLPGGAAPGPIPRQTWPGWKRWRQLRPPFRKYGNVFPRGADTCVCRAPTRRGALPWAAKLRGLKPTPQIGSRNFLQLKSSGSPPLCRNPTKSAPTSRGASDTSVRATWEYAAVFSKTCT